MKTRLSIITLLTPVLILLGTTSVNAISISAESSLSHGNFAAFRSDECNPPEGQALDRNEVLNLI